MQVSTFYYQRPVASKFTRPKPAGLGTMSGAVLEAHHKRHPKPKTIV